ncbi:short-subunit dehydrogenase [Modicisalibacter xianhensis]|uniref:Short-subunit dehydrogenase n=1 Tax=Modicisalibacter xianhensis TaxID=442341 RepID=A0A4R8F935_9GAMM|nr:SDR family NAD(P)-dependent oxidoreductase [Halomonas xianhensis]TDX22134.1 short-subunit dehydrogenase [Halomonas xianhensis]
MKLSAASVLITGAGSGIGQETAIAFARRGARITLSGRKEQPLRESSEKIEAAGGEAQVVVGDVRDASAQQRLVQAAVERFGGLDILVNNAGVVRAGHLEQESDEELIAQIETNLTAPIRLTREALPALRQSEAAAIVNVSSGFGLLGMAFYSTYAATKAGIARFGESLRRELYGEGIHVMTIYPGATETPMMDTAGLGPEQGISYEYPREVAEALVTGIENDEIEVVRGDPALIKANQENPAVVDEQMSSMKASLEQAAAKHRHL